MNYPVTSAENIRNNEKLVTVVAHGSPTGMTNDKTGKRITTAEQLNSTLNKTSTVWKNKESNQGMTVVLYSCRTGSCAKDKQGNPVNMSFAQKVSGSEIFKDVEIIAPDQRVYFGQSGPDGTYKAEYGGKDDEYKPDAKNKQRSDQPGNWNVYKNGELIRSYQGDWQPTNQPSIMDKLLYQN